MPDDSDPSDAEGASTPGDDDTEPAASPGQDPDVDGDSAGERFAPDPERVRVLREIADDLRGESSESEQLANVLYRASDIYDPDEDTTPEQVIQNVKFILEVKERGGLGR